MLADKSAELAQSDGFQHFKAILNLARSRHPYSARNSFLIALQKPDATVVMPYTEWKKAGRRVLSQDEGGQPIYILKPNTKWITKRERPGPGGAAQGHDRVRFDPHLRHLIDGRSRPPQGSTPAGRRTQARLGWPRAPGGR